MEAIEHNTHHNRRYCFIILIIAPLVCILLTVIYIASGMLIHNRQLSAIANELYGSPLPPNTVEINQSAYVANLGPTGDACDYIIQQTLETSLSKSAILSYYKAIETPLSSRNERARTVIEPAEFYAIKVKEHFAALIIPDEQPDPNHLRYILQIVSGRYTEPFDIRCT